MENNKKPEWFELADNDQPVTRRLKGKVSAPKRNFALILAGVLVLPMGAGVALLSHEDQSANAVETLNLTQDSPVATSATPPQTSDAITMPTASREDDNESESEGDDDDEKEHKKKSEGKESKKSENDDDEEDDD
jgi:hypothetical protein